MVEINFFFFLHYSDAKLIQLCVFVDCLVAQYPHSVLLTHCVCSPAEGSSENPRSRKSL